jgi:hypothetical protein
MKKFILISIGSFFTLIVNAQGDLEKRNKMIREIESFLNSYSYYTTIKANYSFEFELLSNKYFSWNNSNENRLFRVEEIITRLEKNNQKELSEAVKADYLKLLGSFYKQYQLPMLEKELYNQTATKPWNTFPYLILNDSIIDISSCFWQKTDSGYKLTNSIDTLAKFDPWRPQKPKNKESIGKEITIRYYNYQDTSITVQFLDSFENNQIRKKNKISPDIYGLVNSEFYRKQSLYKSDVPAVLSSWISDLLNDLKKRLPWDWYEVVQKMSLSYSNLPNETLWVKSDAANIYLSPFLIRAVYIKHIYELYHGNIQEIPNYINRLKNSRQRTIKDDSAVYESLKNGFQRHFYFLLLHELGHPVNNRLKTDRIEELCDCTAVQVIIDNKLQESLGIFEEILIQSIKEGSENLWNVSDQVKILNRLKLLKDKNGKLVSPNCNALIMTGK